MVEPSIQMDAAGAVPGWPVRITRRHAGATLITVAVWSETESLCIEVLDNGIGFDLSAVDRSNHFGLQLIQDRLDADPVPKLTLA